MKQPKRTVLQHGSNAIIQHHSQTQLWYIINVAGLAPEKSASDRCSALRKWSVEDLLHDVNGLVYLISIIMTSVNN